MGASNDDCIVYHFPYGILSEIPIVQWRLREEIARYKRIQWNSEETSKESKIRRFSPVP